MQRREPPEPLTPPNAHDRVLHEQFTVLAKERGASFGLCISGVLLKGSKKTMRRISTVLFVHVLACFGLFAQSVSQITGTVKDSSGLAVPGADITVTQTDTGLVRSAQSGASGTYLMPSLPIGPYKMEVKKEGFSTFVQNGIVLQVDSAPTVDPVLKVGAVSEQIQVLETG